MEQMSEALLLNIYQIIKSNPGIKDNKLRDELNPPVDDVIRLEAINKLKNDGYLKIQLTPEGEIDGYFSQDPDEARKLAQLDKNSEIVYNIVVKSYSQGIISREIKKLSNLGPKVVESALKELEKKELIKSIKGKDNLKGKVYFSSKINPADNVTGGFFYIEGSLNEDLIKKISDFIIDEIFKNEKLSFEEIFKFIKAQSIKDDIREEHIKKIITVLILEDRIEEAPGSLREYYRISRNISAFLQNEFHNIPCLKCPVFTDCHPKGQISPSNCIYFDNWQLAFIFSEDKT